MKNIIISVFLFLFLVTPCMAVEYSNINIYYPNNNTTTQIYYAEGGDYTEILANNVSGNFSAVIIKNEMEYDNIMASPHKIISPIFGLITLLILIGFVVLMVKLIKKVFR